MTSIRFMIVLNTVQFNLGFTIYTECLEGELDQLADDLIIKPSTEHFAVVAI